MEIYEHLSPIIVLKVYNFYENEKIDLVNYIKKLIFATNKTEQNIDLYLDLYNIDKYEIREVYNMISYLVNFSEKEFKYFNKLNLFIDKNMNWLLKKVLSGITLKIPFEIIYLDNEKKWKQMENK